MVFFDKVSPGFSGSRGCSVNTDHYSFFTMDNTMSDPVLSKLLAAKSDLAEQEAKLTALLDSIKAKRASLKAVLEIFDGKKTAVAGQNGAIAAAQRAAAAVVSTPATPTKAAAQKKAAGQSVKKTQTRKTASKSYSKRQGWRRYLRDEYRQLPMPAVVLSILQSQPKKVFAIAEMVDLIVDEPSPELARKWARKRVTNILAEGARNNQWYRGDDSGCYRYAK